MIIGTALGWGDWETVALAVALAFLFGYSLTMVPLLRGGLALGAAAGVAAFPGEPLADPARPRPRGRARVPLDG